MNDNRTRRGFTLVEMLVVISIISVLAALALPAISSSRESARHAACKSNLHEFGVGLASYADRNGRYCSGAFDWRRDGAVTEYGWVADLVKQGTLVGQMLCPSSQHKLGETYQDLLYGTFTAAEKANPRLLGRASSVGSDGILVINPCRQLIDLPPGSAQRRLIVEQKIWGKHFNSNYVASWLLVRSGPRLAADGNLISTTAVPPDIKSLASTLGPTSPARIDSTMVGSMVPFLACGGSTGQRFEETIGDVPAGIDLAEAMTDGPVEKTSLRPPTMASGTNSSEWSRRWSQTLQDYRDFGPVHGRGRGSCNILFADGAVRSFNDDNGDGVMNNGFPASPSSGFADDKVELSDMKITSQWK